MVVRPMYARDLMDEIAPAGKVRVALGSSAAGGAFWSTRRSSGDFAGVPVDLGRAMATELGIAVEFLAFQNSGQITDAAAKAGWDVSFVPRDAEREKDVVRSGL